MRSIAGLTLLVLLAGCGPQQAAQTAAQAQAASGACPTGTGPMQRFELFMGGEIGEKEWNDFLDTEVTPRFPRGFTVVDAHGQWQESNGQISKEGSRILIILLPNTITASAYVGAVASAYSDRFDQDSVLESQSPVCAAFVQGSTAND